LQSLKLLDYYRLYPFKGS